MENWQTEFRQIASKVEHAIDRGRLKVKQQLNLLDDITIQAYRGYGNNRSIFISGRVLEKEGLDVPAEDASLWGNLKTLYHRYESDEVPQAPVQYKLENLQGEIVTDDEGYFSAEINNEENLTGWQKIEYTLLKQYKKDQPQVRMQDKILLQSPDSSYGLISDLDDTVIVSQATNFLEKSRILLLNNERTRKPFEGVAAFYRALQKGKDEHRYNPVFYVSSSSWNLYDMFKNFCHFNHLPEGVFLLRDVGLDKQKFYRTGHGTHKLHKITHVLDTFDNLSFLLIGDSGQKDPEIYQEVVQQYPERIMGIYIRDVDPHLNKPRDLEVKAIAEKVSEAGVPMLLVQNSLEAARHASTQGWIPEIALAAIEQETNEDKAEKQDIRKTLGLHKIFG